MTTLTIEVPDKVEKTLADLVEQLLNVNSKNFQRSIFH